MGNLKQISTLDFFESLIASVTLAIFVCLLPDYNWYFGVDAHFILNKFLSGSPKGLLLDLLTYFPSLSVAVLVTLLLSNLMTILGFSSLGLRIVRAISVYWLHQRLWVIGDGGMNLLVLSQLFLCLKDLPFLKIENRKGLNESLLWLLKGQLLLVYVTAFFSKMAGAEWVQGEALGIVVQIDKFQSPLLHSVFMKFPILEKVGTAAVILLQGLLPLGLGFAKGKLKNLVIALGVAMHLGIAIHMGLVGFSLVMIVHYSLFIDTREWNFLGIKVNTMAQGLLTVLVVFNFLSLGLVNSKDPGTEILNIGGKEKTVQEGHSQIIPFASITKLFTLSLIDSLQSKNKINIDEVFETPAGRFKIRDLLSFQAGILDLKTDRKKLSGFSWENWKEFFFVQKGFRGYSNFSYALVQYILEIHLKKKFDKLLEENLHLSNLKISRVTAEEIPYNASTLAAFGLQGPLGALRILSKNIRPEGFCINQDSFCVSGAVAGQVQYFLGNHGYNKLYVVFSKKGLHAVNTWSQSFSVGI